MKSRPSFSDLEAKGRGGDPQAQYALSALLNRSRRWAEGLTRVRHPLAARLPTPADLAGTNSDAPHVDANPDWALIATHLDRPPAAPLPELRQLCERPSVWSLEKLLSVEECDYLVGV